MTSTWGKPFSSVAWACQFLRDEHDLESLQLERLLAPIAQELTANRRYFEALEVPENNEERGIFESHLDDKCEEVEGLLSVAFVIAQTHITQVASRALRLLESAKDAGSPLQGVPTTRDGLLRTCSLIAKNTEFTEIQVINAFANYFKHNEEWVGSWEGMKNKQAQSTAKVMTSAGATQGSTGTFRTGSEALGNGTYDNVGIFVGIIREWRIQLATLLEAAARSAGHL